MTNPSIPTLPSDISEQSTDFGSLNLDAVPFKRRNPKFEKMRSSLRNTLIQTSKSHSLTALPLSTQRCNTEEDKSTPTSANADISHDGLSLGNSRLEKHRKLVKGNLFPQILTRSICSLEKGLNDTHDEIYPTNRNQPSMTSLVFTPTNSGLDELNPDNVGFGSYVEKDHPGRFTKVEESKHEESFSVDEVPYGSPKAVLRNPFRDPQSLDFLESPYRGDTDQRSSIFLRDIESEVAEIKKDLDLERDENIHFIKGNFYNYYTEEDILGEGTSGLVKKCIKIDTNESFAVKIVHYRDDLEMLMLIVKEFQNHRKLHHRNIIKVYNLYIDYFTKKIYTVMELAECTEMFDVLKDLGHYSEAVASGIFKQILTGINYLHISGVCHRDLKPNNILVSKDGKIVKITDFNVSKFIENKKKKYSFLSTENYKMWTYTGTIAFTAPEVFLDTEYSESVDMWSAGAVLYTMLCGYQPFQAEYVADLIEMIKAGKYDFPADPWDTISKQAKSLVKHCLDVNPKTRYSPSDALMHPWIANCGKIPNTNIPRTGYYLKRYLKRNTLRKDKKHQPTQKVQKSSYSRYQTFQFKPDDHSIHVGSELLDELEELEEPLSGGALPHTHQTVSHLQPKRGKTGPEGVEFFRPTFLLKLEKSFSYSAIEDPKYYGPYIGKAAEDEEHKKQTEKIGNENANVNNIGLEIGHGIPCFFENGVFVIKQKLDDGNNKAKEDEANTDMNKSLCEVDQNINKANGPILDIDKHKDEKNGLEIRKDRVVKGNKENPLSQEHEEERTWLEKRLYNEPLQMQE